MGSRYESTLFIVDDDADARRSLVALCQSLGLPAETYATAEEFLAVYDPARPGCAIVDLRLAHLSGLELLTRLRQLGATLPVIVVSAYADIRLTVQAMRAGAHSVLEKPCNAAELTQMVHAAIEQDRQRRSQLAQRSEIEGRVYRLDPRERRVMEAMLADRPNKSIMRELGVSRRTVDRIRAAVFEKTGAHSAVELARLVSDVVGASDTRAADNGAPLSDASSGR